MYFLRATLLLFAASSAANAADIAVIGVPNAGQSLRDDQAWVAALTHAIDTSGNTARTLDDPTVANALASQAADLVAQAILTDAIDAIDTAQSLIDRAELHAANALLGRAIDQAERAADTLTNTDVLAGAWAWRAVTLLRQGQSTDARDALATAIALHPQALPFDVWPDDLLELDAALRPRQRTETGSLSLTVDSPNPATLSLDGTNVGGAPLALPSVVAGHHHVHARTIDGKVGHVAVDLLAGATPSYRVSVHDPALIPVADDARTATALYTALADTIGVDALLLVDETVGSHHIQAFHRTDRDFGPMVDLPADVADSASIDVAVRTALASTERSDQPAFALRDQRTLAFHLLLPGVPTRLAVSAARATGLDPSAPHAHKLRWPAWLGIGLGIAAGAAIGATLGVLLPQHQAGDTPDPGDGNGHVVITPPGQP